MAMTTSCSGRQSWLSSVLWASYNQCLNAAMGEALEWRYARPPADHQKDK